MDDTPSWIRDLQAKAVRSTIVFLQIGAIHDAAREALQRSSLQVIAMQDYLQDSLGSLNGEIYVLDGIEALVAGDNGFFSMGQLREKVFSDVDRGLRFVLASRAPRAAFADVPGSSLLDDAVFAHIPVDGITKFEDLPACESRPAQDVLKAAIVELGQGVVGALDRAVFDSMLVEAGAFIPLRAREVEALIGCGIARKVDGQYEWMFPFHLNGLKEALANVIAADVRPQAELGQVMGGLWQIERIIRRSVRERSLAAWGPNWRKSCLHEDLKKKVLERATESACPAASSVAQLRDPLEWLSLAELLALKDRSEIGGLGLTAAQWRSFGSEVMPIRNRIAHMRTLHPSDSVDVGKWLRVLELKLNAT